ncbi:DNA-dependent ATPase RAD26 NDAI_0G04840 [Naumovozyma dairenensis CBS 421]|uniref:DNA helicase n=1 Tax=Naumovozyma dairenensis (strain ATCC 10597 / BCRC 20456 / CBS 421 / NBRC 0211 / NRRL Y-12639) TaxID=1071378 RepID=J7RTC1_NAUDC|nr:hypothetical protein NDAI_0G04840 [Naumovozyma dairenensis CBS 421]CCK73467.1 hypothetical protein NDAI_0G04840 [Naumovozyma dairenensis CBS 421]
MKDEEEELQQKLGLVNALSQTTLEARISRDVQAHTNETLLLEEQKRLERSENLLHKLQGRIRLLERKNNDPKTKISVREKNKKEIAKLQQEDLRQCFNDINAIKQRLYVLRGKVGADAGTNAGGVFDQGNVVEDENGKRIDESERDFLIRTGKVTAFGSTTGFTLEETIPTKKDENKIKTKQEHDYDEVHAFEMANEQMVENLSDEDEPTITEEDKDQDFIPEKEEEETEDEDTYNPDEELQELEDDPSIISKPGETKDDGDEFYYRKRLQKWITKRSKDRQFDPFPDLDEWRKPHPNIPDAKLNDIFKIPGDIFSLLFNYQKTCVQWLYELHQQNSGGIIGDEMGLGKTIQIIAFLASLHHSGLLDGPVLIVCPATVMKQWCNELHHWWPPFRTIILHSIGSGMGINQKKNLSDEEFENLLMNSNPNDISYEDLQNNTKRKTKSHLENDINIQSLINTVIEKGHIIITTYVGLRLHSDKLLNVNWSYAILDEGHKIRNPDSDISITCKKIKTHNRIILSGTPIQNNLIELWSLFDFIYPGKLGTLPVFQQQFIIPINTGGYANASNIQVQTGIKCATALRDLISPYLLRRVKNDVAKDLPEKKEMVLFCKLTQYQRIKYLEFLNSNELTQIKGGKRHVLYGIDILRKICNHPDLIDRNEKQYDLDYGNPKRSGKMQVVKQLLLLWHNEKHKVLLFTQSRQMLDILENFINSELKSHSEFSTPLKYLRMDGTTNISNRQKLVDQFNNEDYDVFLLTTRVGGLGINLTGANRIIIFDPDWNPSTDMQARERAWRIGQKREVSIYRLMVAGSIEEKIYHRQIFKQFLTNKILTDPKQKRFFKMNELRDLFTLGGDDGLASEELNNELEKHTQSLKKGQTEESDDFDQVTGLNGVSKLESFYSGKEKNEDERLIEGLLGSETALANAATHEAVVGTHTAPTNIIAREANKIAQEALGALRKSRKATMKYEIGTPTWTGKFGQAGKIRKKMNNKKQIGGSSAILANIKKATQIKSPASSDINNPNEHEILLSKIEQYLHSAPDKFATSADIINNLGVNLNEKKDIIRVRALLRTIAHFDRNKKGWYLNDEFQNE